VVILKNIIVSEQTKIVLKPVSNEILKAGLLSVLDHLEKLFDTKNKEYAQNDAMIVFNQIALKHNIQPEKALAILRAKHEESIVKIQNDINNGVVLKNNFIIEKYGDIIMYYILESIMLLRTNLKNENNKN
jgi:hypothetical protein